MAITLDMVISWVVVIGVGGAIIALTKSLWNTKFNSLEQKFCSNFVSKKDCFVSQSELQKTIQQQLDAFCKDIKTYIGISVENAVLKSHNIILKELRKMNSENSSTKENYDFSKDGS